MGILTRVIRLCKADLHGVMDQIENQELLLKQHLRDMQAALMQKRATLNQICRARERVLQDSEKTDKKRASLEVDLEIALKNDKDDIGRMLIKKLKPLVGIQAERRQHIDRLTRDIKQLQDKIEQQQLQYEQLQQKAGVYFHRTEQKSWEDIAPVDLPGYAAHDLSEEEIELELLQRKEAIKGGKTS
ncbi:MAG: PspA/IM30 family protein [Desulfobacterales bacterium]